MDTIQSLWVRGTLGTMQRLSINSYLAQGHPFHLYSYEEIKVPRGVKLKDARTVLPEARVDDFKHLANFSDQFRYQMLYDHGGWWVDLDTVCLKPFDFPEPYVFAQEQTHQKPLLNGGYIKTPAKAAIIAAALKECQTLNPKVMGWGAMGPQLLNRLVYEFDMVKFAKPIEVFNEVAWWDSPKCFITGAYRPSSSAYAVHLWNEMWGRNHTDKESTFDPQSFYETFKQRFL